MNGTVYIKTKGEKNIYMLLLNDKNKCNLTWQIIGAMVQMERWLKVAFFRISLFVEVNRKDFFNDLSVSGSVMDLSRWNSTNFIYQGNK